MSRVIEPIAVGGCWEVKVQARAIYHHHHQEVVLSVGPTTGGNVWEALVAVMDFIGAYIVEGNVLQTS